MSRTRIELESKDNEQLSQIINNILSSHGYEYTLYKKTEEQVWTQGIGLVKAPKYIKYYFENNKLILEGWISTYGKETDLNGVVGALPKRDVKKVLKEIEESVNSFNLNSSNNNAKYTNENFTKEDKPLKNTDTTITPTTTNNNNTDKNINQTQNSTNQPNISNKNLRNRLIIDIISMVISLIILMGALMGGLVLRGTNSSGALAIFILLILIYEIYIFIKHYQQYNAFNNQFKPKQPNIPSQTSNNENLKPTTNFTNKNIKPEEKNIKTENNNITTKIPPMQNNQNIQQNNQIITPNSKITQNQPINQTSQQVPTANNNISNRIKNMDDKKKKIYLAIIAVAIISIILGLMIAGSNDNSYYRDSSYSDSYNDYSSTSIRITDVTESKLNGSNNQYSYLVYGKITGSTLPYNSYIDIEYYDSDGLLIRQNTNRGNFMENTEINIDNYVGDTKVYKVNISLYDPDGNYISQDIYYI